MLLQEHVRTTNPPWVQLLVVGDGEKVDCLYDQPWGFIVKEIDGRKCETESELFSEFARVFEFPSYFGKNWDALDECITDMEWRPAHGYIVLVQNAKSVLADDENKYKTFLSVMKRAGEEWATPQAGQWPRPAIPFHTIFIISQDKEAKRRSWGIPETTL